MATGDKKVNLFEDRLLSRTALKNQLLDYLSQKIDETISALFQGKSGVLGSNAIGLSSDGNDMIKIDVSFTDRVVVSSGLVITLPADIPGQTRQIPIENASGVVYYTGIKYAQIASDPQVNPRKGNAEYASLEDSFGEVDYPSSSPVPVNTQGVNLRLYIDTITEVGVDHSGRTCRVWLTSPENSDNTIAFFEGTTAFDGTNNYLDLPYSGADGPLGQDTGGGNPPTLDPLHYRVFIKGVSWKRNTDLRTDADYAFIGTVTGTGSGTPPGPFSTGDQFPVFLTSLDAAYDGAGTGQGRRILVDAEPMELQTTAGAGTQKDTQMFLTRQSDSADSGHCLSLVAKSLNGQAISGFVVLTDGTNLQYDETIETDAGGKYNFTRSGVDLVTAGVSDNTDFVLIKDMATGSYNGLLRIASRDSATQLTLTHLDGSAQTPAGVVIGTGYVIRPIFSAGGKDYGGATPDDAHGGGVVVNGSNVAGMPAMRIFQQSSSQALQIYRIDGAGASVMFEVDANNMITKTGGTLEATDLEVTGNVVGTALNISTPTTLDNDLTLQSGYDFSNSADNTNFWGAVFNLNAGVTMSLGAGAQFNMTGDAAIKSGSTLDVESGGIVDVLSGGVINLQSGGDISVKSGGEVLLGDGTVKLTYQRLYGNVTRTSIAPITLFQASRTATELIYLEYTGGSVAPLVASQGLVEVQNWFSSTFFRLDGQGRVITPHVFMEDFYCLQHKVALGTSSSEIDTWRAAAQGSLDGSEEIEANYWGSEHISPGGGYVMLRPPNDGGGRIFLTTPMCMPARAGSYNYQPASKVQMWARCAFDGWSNVEYFVGLLTRYNYANDVYLKHSGIIGDHHYIGFWHNGSDWRALEHSVISITGTDHHNGDVSGNRSATKRWIDFYIHLNGDNTTVDCWMSGMGTTMHEYDFSWRDTMGKCYGGYFGQYNAPTTGNAYRMWCDYIEMADDNLKQPTSF